MDEETPKWAQLLITKVDNIDSKVNGMQDSIDGLRTLLNSTCDRVSTLENIR